ncbi:2-oxo-4-hydroxy-4-carboxy-5-ureidoimidazoline decarboxylase [Nocardia sp. NPDC052566]|uniref:2-oxo-4-hydroxy-4-carboxy-5-ureidoimidazoline decarboxylase n=1 Tax=Nocardia sp. NPDC052566 TaxID=3364330 RepID=UPI0037CC8295
MTADAAGIDGLNVLSAAEAANALLDCCASPEWAATLVALRPFLDRAALFDAADAAVARLPEAEIDLALAGHPRIGERADSAASAREQAGVATAEDEVKAALAAGNRAYEARFGHIYLVCASGRSGAELLELLTARLDNDPETERRVMRTELAKINRIRLGRLLG